jgi:hypothetical protein
MGYFDGAELILERYLAEVGGSLEKRVTSVTVREDQRWRPRICKASQVTKRGNRKVMEKVIFR